MCNIDVVTDASTDVVIVAVIDVANGVVNGVDIDDN